MKAVQRAILFTIIILILLVVLIALFYAGAFELVRFIFTDFINKLRIF
jgi:hypothetical protein